VTALLLVTMLPHIATGQERTVDEVAVAAAEVHQQHCADIYTGDIDLAAEGYAAVAPIWQQVSEVYEGAQEPLLLYWRGLLAQCLGQREQGLADLDAFVAAEGENRDLAAMVRDANRRIRRLRVELDVDEARQDLGAYELRRYRRSGLSLGDWYGRRHAMGQRLVLLAGVGMVHGPYRTRHVQAVTVGGDEWIAVDWLESGPFFRFRIGLEVWPAGAIGVGVATDLAAGELAYAAVEVPDLESAAAPVDEDGTKSIFWLVGSVWAVTTPLPRKPFKPLFRVGPWFRYVSDEAVGEHDIRSAAWEMLSLGVFAGVAYHPRTVAGVEIGVWFVGDLTPGSKVSGDADQAPLISTAGNKYGRMSIYPAVLFRTGL